MSNQAFVDQCFVTDETRTAVLRVSEALLAAKLTCVSAESCTGGLIGALLTSLSGSSAWFAGGIIAYDNAVKIAGLGLEPEILREHGAVSQAVAEGMALGACRALGAGAAIAATGIAGPDGGSPAKPVGTVWLAWAVMPPAGKVRQKYEGPLSNPAESLSGYGSGYEPEYGVVRARSFAFSGQRNEIRYAAALQAIIGLDEILRDPGALCSLV